MKRRRIMLVVLAVMGLAALGVQAAERSGKKSARIANKAPHPWAGKRVGYIGDSITDPRVGQRSGVVHYWQWLKDWLGIEPFVYGINGSQWSDAIDQIDRLHNEHGQDVDAIMVFLGTNDYYMAVPLGQWWDYDATGHRTLNMDEGTLRGRINRAMSHLKALYPTKQIVMLTPIHRAYATFGPTNVQPDEGYPNKLGIYFETYIDAINETSALWSVPVIDLYRLSGVNPMIESQVQYFLNPQTDRLHPNAEGHRRMAHTILQQLSALPCVF